jgi:hypothetical protein
MDAGTEGGCDLHKYYGRSPGSGQHDPGRDTGMPVREALNCETWESGAMGIRTPDLLHAMSGDSVWPCRAESDIGRSGE